MDLRNELSCSTPTSSNHENNEEDKIIVINKSVVLDSNLPVFDEEFYKWKKDFWKNRIANIKNVVAPMVDQR